MIRCNASTPIQEEKRAGSVLFPKFGPIELAGDISLETVPEERRVVLMTSLVM